MAPGFALMDAAGPEAGQAAGAVGLGFPVAFGWLAFGLGDRVDVRLGVDTMYSLYLQPWAGARVRVAGERYGGTALAVEIAGAFAWFRVPAQAEFQGARFLTGQRDIGATVRAVLSKRDRRIAISSHLGLQTTVDLDPRPSGPLTGLPPPFTLGFNVPIGMTFEFPLSRLGRRANGFFVVEIALHLRGEDFPALPQILFGVTFGTPPAWGGGQGEAAVR